MSRWTSGQAEYIRVAKNVQTLVAGVGAKGVTVQLQNGTRYHGLVGPMTLGNNCANIGSTVPTQLCGTVQIQTASGDVDLDMVDIEIVMAH